MKRRIASIILFLSALCTARAASVGANELVFAAEVFPATISREIDRTPLPAVRDAPALREARAWWDAEIAGGIEETMRSAGLAREDFHSLGSARISYLVWRRPGGNPAFGAGVVLTSTDEARASDIASRWIRALRDRTETEEALPPGVAVLACAPDSPLYVGTKAGRTVFCSRPDRIDEAAAVASEQPPMGRIWSRIRFVPQALIAAFDESGQSAAAGMLRAAGFENVRGLDAAMRWDGSAGVFRTRAFLRIDGTFRGVFTRAGERPPGSILRTIVLRPDDAVIRPVEAAGELLRRLDQAERAALPLAAQAACLLRPRVESLVPLLPKGIAVPAAPGPSPWGIRLLRTPDGIRMEAATPVPPGLLLPGFRKEGEDPGR